MSLIEGATFLPFLGVGSERLPVVCRGPSSTSQDGAFGVYWSVLLRTLGNRILMFTVYKAVAK